MKYKLGSEGALSEKWPHKDDILRVRSTYNGPPWMIVSLVMGAIEDSGVVRGGRKERAWEGGDRWTENAAGVCAESRAVCVREENDQSSHTIGGKRTRTADPSPVILIRLHQGNVRYALQ